MRGNGEAQKPMEDSDHFAEVERNLGAVLNMIAGDPQLAGKPLAELHERVLPALVSRQFRMVRERSGEISAYISWALASKELEQRLLKDKRLAPSDWQSGETALIVDLVANTPQKRGILLNAVKQGVLCDRVVKALRKDEASQELAWAVVELSGKEHEKEE